jgi:hypothetical protein
MDADRHSLSSSPIPKARTGTAIGGVAEVKTCADRPLQAAIDDEPACSGS